MFETTTKIFIVFVLNILMVVEILINENNLENYQIILKKRRVMGMQPKTFTFRTHKRIDDEYYNITTPNSHRVQKISKLKIFARLFIIGKSDKLLSDGAKTCFEEYDKDYQNPDFQFDDSGKFYLKEEDKNKPIRSSAELGVIFRNLPSQKSFKIYEYEYQIFYLKCLIEGSIPVCVMRHLYHANMNLIDLSKDDLVNELISGLSPDTLQSCIYFEKLP